MKKSKLKLACRDDLLMPYEIEKKYELALELGFDAIELHGSNIWTNEQKIIKAYEQGIKFSNIAAGFCGSLVDKRISEQKKAYALLFPPNFYFKI